MKTFSISLFLMLGAIVSGSGQTHRTDINPALLYHQSFLSVKEPISEEEDAYLCSKEGSAQKLPDRFKDIVARYDYQFTLLRQAMRSTVPCDWGIDLSYGPDAQLGHLARVKAAAQTAGLRVRWALQNGRQSDACDDLLASFVLGRNASRDGTLIAILVQNAVQVTDCCALAANFGQFSPESLKKLIDGFDAAPTQGLAAPCIAKEFSNDRFIEKFRDLQKANPKDEAKVLAEIHKYVVDTLDQESQDRKPSVEEINERSGWNKLMKASGGTSEGILNVFRSSEPLAKKFTDILALPQGEFESKIQQLKAEAQNSPDPFLLLNIKSLQRVPGKEARSLVYLAMARAAVEYKLHGDAGFKSVKDPSGKGPFGFRRFIFEGVDRGFELKSECNYSGWPETLIFVEKEGPGFYVNGKPGHAGTALPSVNAKK